MKWRFAAKFLLTFAGLIPLWWALSLGEWYRDAIHLAVGWASPLVTGWWLDTGDVATGGRAVFRRSGAEVPLLLNLPAIAMSLMPLTSLLAATPAQSLRLLALRLPIAVGACLLLHSAVVLVFPWIVHEPNAIKDTLGVFTGLLAFVVAPLGVWFTLTYPTMRALWGIER